MAEIKSPPVKISFGDLEYDAFGDEHSWRDVARWIVAHGPSDAEDFRRCFDEVESDL